MMNRLVLKYIEEFLNNNINYLEKEFDIKVLFGAVGGSYSLGLENATSDIDYYLICNGELKDQVCYFSKTIMIENCEQSVDFMCVGIETACKQNVEARKNIINYPSCFYRTLEQEQLAKLQDKKRPDFPKDIMFRTLMADVIWKNSKYMENQYRDILNDYILMIDVIDYNFVRAYGNYKNCIEKKEKVLIRKYLYVIHEVLTCLWIIRYENKPPMNFHSLISGFKEIEIYDRIENLFYLNSASQKSKDNSFVDADNVVNDYLEEAIRIIKKEMEQSKEYYLGKCIIW